MDVGVEQWDPVDRGRGHLGHQLGEGLLLAVGGGRVAAQVVNELVERSPVGWPGQLPYGVQQVVLGEPGLHPVDHQGGDRHVRFRQLAGEVDGLVHRVGAGEATSTKAVLSWTSSSRTRAARVRKPSSIPRRPGRR